LAQSGHFAIKLQCPLSGVKQTFDRRATQVCPTTTIDTIVSRNVERRLVPVRSGLLPSWRSKPLKELTLTTFNAWADNEQTHWGTSPEG
jgi:putative SOS response-associated peptidase YedK